MAVCLCVCFTHTCDATLEGEKHSCLGAEQCLYGLQVKNSWGPAWGEKVRLQPFESWLLHPASLAAALTWPPVRMHGLSHPACLSCAPTAAERLRCLLQGYFRLHRDIPDPDGTCGIATTASYPIKTSPNPPPPPPVPQQCDWCADCTISAAAVTYLTTHNTQPALDMRACVAFPFKLMCCCVPSYVQI